MEWKDVPAGVINGAQQRFWVSLGEQADLVANCMNSNPDFVSRVAVYAINGGFEPTTSQKSARAIMGTNFFGIEEAIQHFGVNPTRSRLAALSEVPFSEATLAESRDTHILVAVFPLSILEIRGKVDKKVFFNQGWYNKQSFDKQSFAKNKGGIGWHLVRKTPVPSSTSKTWDEQQALLAANELTPSARIMTYTIIGHFLATSVRLFEKTYIRCSDLDSDGDRVYVGNFGADGLDVDSGWDDYRRGDLGVSAALKFD